MNLFLHLVMMWIFIWRFEVLCRALLNGNKTVINKRRRLWEEVIIT